MSQSWRYTPPEGWELMDFDEDGPAWLWKGKDNEVDLIRLDSFPRGIEGYEAAMLEVDRIQRASPKPTELEEDEAEARREEYHRSPEFKAWLKEVQKGCRHE